MLLVDEDVARWVKNLAAAQVSITATANTGHTFKSWTGSGSGSYTGTNASPNHHHELIDQGDSKLYLVAFAFEYSLHGRRGAHIYMGDPFSFSKWKEIG